MAGRQPIVAGNIGEPLIAALDPERPRTYVVELSSFQLETVDTFRANVALLLNITPDHMDRYATFDDYTTAKYRIFRNRTATRPSSTPSNAARRRAMGRCGCGASRRRKRWTRERGWMAKSWSCRSAATSAAFREPPSNCRDRRMRRTRSRHGWRPAPPASTTWTCRSRSAPSPASRIEWWPCASRRRHVDQR